MMHVLLGAPFWWDVGTRIATASPIIGFDTIDSDPVKPASAHAQDAETGDEMSVHTQRPAKAA